MKMQVGKFLFGMLVPKCHFLTQCGLLGEEVRMRNNENYKWFGKEIGLEEM